jgi:hypothetical protein
MSWRIVHYENYVQGRQAHKMTRKQHEDWISECFVESFSRRRKDTKIVPLCKYFAHVERNFPVKYLVES